MFIAVLSEVASPSLLLQCGDMSPGPVPLSALIRFQILGLNGQAYLFCSVLFIVISFYTKLSLAALILP